MQYKGKESLIQLAGLLSAKGINIAVVSPGSRNAPLIAALNRQGIQCLSVVDERSAAYFALGIAQQKRVPVAIACTSGTAALNYAPAIAEAYYQMVPLLILTADRPPEWIDQGDGQAINQNSLYSNYIRKSVQLPSEPWNESTLRYNARLINDAIDACTFPVDGPVHINIPLSEPLYKEETVAQPEVSLMQLVRTIPKVSYSDLEIFADIWNNTGSKLVIAGMLAPNPDLNQALNQLAEDPGTVVLTESTSNLHGRYFLQNIDRLIDGFEKNSDHEFIPDLLLTIGGHIVSRKVKAWLRRYKPKTHWHIAPVNIHVDTFKSLSHTIPVKAETFFGDFLPLIRKSKGSYRELWLEQHGKRASRHKEFLKNCPWSDLKAFKIILDYIPHGTLIQAGNSTPVRYLQLFDAPGQTICFGNRGVSGIDGCTSTAAGAAWANSALTVLFSGDIAFLYDSNALWNNNLTPNLRIIVMNNGGGNIFRIIEGPDTMPEMETYIETPYVPEIKYLAEMFGLKYFQAFDSETLKNCLPEFLNSNISMPALLEIKTVNKISASILREYFNFLRS